MYYTYNYFHSILLCIYRKQTQLSINQTYLLPTAPACDAYICRGLMRVVGGSKMAADSITA